MEVKFRNVVKFQKLTRTKISRALNKPRKSAHFSLSFAQYTSYFLFPLLTSALLLYIFSFSRMAYATLATCFICFL